MPDQPVATPTGAAASGVGDRKGWVGAARRVLGGRPVRYGFVAVAVGLGVYAVARQWGEVRDSLVAIGVLPVVGAMVAILGGLAASMQVWRVLLTSLGSPLPVRAAAKVVFVGQLGKYLGTVYHVPRRRSATASVLTMLMSLLGGLLAALVTLPFMAGAATAYRWAFLAAPVLLACVHPRVLNPVLDRLLRLVRRPALEQPLTGRAVLVALGWALVSWVLYGVQIWVLATRLGAPEGRTILLAVGGFAFAWSVGFLVVFAPAGAGVRDVLLIALLGPVVGTGGATAIALVSRILMTVGDLATAGVSAWLGRLRAPSSTRPGVPATTE
jgi:uncharacterized membrane protein YbhN (UPF0104 family)